ncbi:related to Mig1 protein [Ustilago bromivora]|uniref:Related to Mig1 protein n=1 Tax=Ustilago bromivora TaxID=307758 RepID=A0A1K0HDE6_9BASI|nr:related to Mig1 protein [Ustilago bromivora]
MTRPLQCLTSLVVLALVPGQSAHCAVVKQSSAPGSKIPLYDESERSINGYCGITQLFVDKTEYEKHCEEKSTSKWPCFKSSVDASLQYVTIEPWLEPLDMPKEIVLMDKTASAFTLSDPSVAFTITYSTEVSLRYYDYDDKTGCYKIHLHGTDKWRIFVSDGNGDDRDIDTQHYTDTGKQLCSKWITIGIKDKYYLEMHDSDNRGI